MFWFIISSLSSLVTIFLWLREEFRTRNRHLSRLLYPTIFCFLAASSAYAFFRLNELNEIRDQAGILYRQWPQAHSSEISMESNGQLMGIVLSGQAFLEKHKQQFPDTYQAFIKMKADKSEHTRRDSTSYKDYTEMYDLRDMADATITMVKVLASQQ